MSDRCLVSRTIRMAVIITIMVAGDFLDGIQKSCDRLGFSWLIFISHRDCKCAKFGQYFLGVLTKTPSGGGDMEIQKACPIYYVVTSSACLRHN